MSCLEALIDLEKSRLEKSVRRDEFETLDLNRAFELWLTSLAACPSLDRSFSSSSSSVSDDCFQRPGEIRFADTLRIDGRVTANVCSEKGMLIVSEGGDVDADISVDVALIQGLVRGRIKAKSVKLAATAQVIGSIDAPSLTIEAGAVFEGYATSASASLRAEIDKVESLRPAFPEADSIGAEDAQAKALAVGA
jgi:cytoskeletal protein CcmA (bactofilin family)